MRDFGVKVLTVRDVLSYGVLDHMGARYVQPCFLSNSHLTDFLIHRSRDLRLDCLSIVVSSLYSSTGCEGGHVRSRSQGLQIIFLLSAGENSEVLKPGLWRSYGKHKSRV